MLSKVRPGTYVLASYDFLAWVLGFLAMSTLQYLVGYSTRDDIAPSVVLGVACGLVFVLLGLPLHLHRGPGRPRVVRGRGAPL